MRRRMFRFFVPSFFIVAAACGGQNSTDVCVIKLDVQDQATVQVNSTTTLHAQLLPKSGSCPSPLKGSLTWSSANAPVLQLLSSTDTTASVKGLKAGKSIVTAFMTLTPSVRDSVEVTVVAPTDTNQ